MLSYDGDQFPPKTYITQRASYLHPTRKPNLEKPPTLPTLSSTYDTYDGKNPLNPETESPSHSFHITTKKKKEEKLPTEPNQILNLSYISPVSRTISESNTPQGLDTFSIRKSHPRHKQGVSLHRTVL